MCFLNHSALLFLPYLFSNQVSKVIHLFKIQSDLTAPFLTLRCLLIALLIKAKILPMAWRAPHDLGPACPPASSSMTRVISALGPLVFFQSQVLPTHLGPTAPLHLWFHSVPRELFIIVQAKAALVNCFFLTRPDHHPQCLLRIAHLSSVHRCDYIWSLSLSSFGP